MFGFFRKLDKAMSPYVLLALNLAIIAATELVGGGKLFFDWGIIHAIAILFIILAGTRVITRYYISDPLLKKFLVGSLLALVAFAISHFVEFISLGLLGQYEDTAFADVVNLYCISLLFVFIGSESVVVAYKNRSSRLVIAASALAIVFAGLTAYYLSHSDFVSLEPDEPAPYLYAVAILALSAAAIVRVRKVGSLFSALKPFTDRLTVAAILVTAATIPNVFYEGLEKLGLETHQVIYLSHFTFYAALSILYLAFGKFRALGGVFADVKKEMETGQMP